MSELGLADQNDLRVWADSVGARTEFPRLVRRLILETARGLVRLGLPAGEGVSSGSWDGTVRTTEATAFVPARFSLWELSVEKAMGAKAEADYAKRLTTLDGSPTTECTYVAASLRRWGKRGEFEKERRKDGRWSEVRAHGLDDIEAWLETAPVTRAWISEVLGLHPYGLRSAEAWWAAWAAETNPALTPGVLLAGRDSQLEALAKRFTEPGQVATVKGASLTDVQAFVAAAAVRADAIGTSQVLARMAFVDDPAAWRRLTMQESPLVLVPVTEEVKAEVVSFTPHLILVPVPGASAADIELPPIDAAGAAAALLEAGTEDDRRAESAGRLARRSLIALRRNLARKPELHVPSWARDPAPRATRGILLAGSWSERLDGDKEALRTLTGDDYDVLREKLASLATTDDPFVALIDTTWGLVSAFDAWLVLRSHVTEDDLKRLEDVVRMVMGERDPALDLTPEDRWKASIEGKVRAFSSDIREGLANTLALLGVHGNEIALSGGSTGATWAAYLVRVILDAANADSSGDLWASFTDLLPLIGEAAPDRFLEAVGTGARGTDPVLRKLFIDTDGGMFGPSSPHPGLLWALEDVSWSQDHFGHAVELLARLDEIDPGGRLANRPFESLASIFRPWHPDTSVDAGRRLGVLDALRKRHPYTAWRLMIAMLPEGHGIHHPIHEPRYREWKPARRRAVTVAEYMDFVYEVVTRVLEDVGEQSERWADVLDKMPHLPPTDRGRVSERLSALLDGGALSATERESMWKSLRKLIGVQREYSDADWALPHDEVDRLEELALRVAPQSAYSRSLWLFTEQMPHLGNGAKKTDHALYESELAAQRREAVGAIVAEGGLDTVRRLAGETVVPWAVGVALADAAGDTYEEDLLPLVGTENRSDADLAFAYFARRFEKGGRDWLLEVMDAHDFLTEDQQARLLLSTHDFPTSWETADARGDGVARAFWASFVPLGLGRDFPYVLLVAERLTGVGRNAAALDFLGIYRSQAGAPEDAVAELVARGLDGVLVTQDADPEFNRLSSYDYEQAFELLERNRVVIGEDRLAGLEWAYLPALGLHPDVPTLYDRMAQDPRFFTEIAAAVFRPAAGDDDVALEPQEETNRQRRAENGYRLLTYWSRPPGLLEEGKMDRSALRAWVEETRGLLVERDRADIGDSQIGQVLAASPSDEDGAWPGEAVRDLIEELASEHLESGFATAVFNRRGITTRAPDEGGAQEMDLVRRYRSEAERFADRWPRTAALLRKLADSYEHDARREDGRAERFRRGLEP